MTKIELIKRLYKSYTRRYIKNIFVAVFFTILLAGSTSGVAYLLDPAIKQLFIEQDQSLIYIIPGLIVLAFIVKGSSLYIARVIMINVSEEVRKDIQTDMFANIIKADTQLIDKITKFAPIKHILKKKLDYEIIELLEDLARDLNNYDLEFRIQELESKFSKDLSEATFNELKELKKKQNIN